MTSPETTATITNWQAEIRRLKAEPPTARRDREIELLGKLIRKAENGGAYRPAPWSEKKAVR